MISRGAVWLVAAVLLMGLAVAGGGRPALGDSAGRLIVIDGDTLSRDGEIIQLRDIDAPELGQQCLDGDTLYPCGLAAAYGLQKMLSLEPVTCARESDTAPSYECRTPGGSLSRKLVEDGLAAARSGSDLEAVQDGARRVPLGIWRGEFVDPRIWRNGTRLAREPSGTDACPVLGFVRDDKRAYAVPTDPAYEAISRGVAGTTSGHAAEAVQRFCSDEAARASGYVHLAE